MGSYYHRFDWAGIKGSSPATYTEIWLTSRRSGINIIVDATVKGSFLYPAGGGHLAYDGEINFNIWSGSVNNSANLKAYSNKWYASSESSRTRTTSITVATTASSIDVSFNVVCPASDPHAMSVATTTVTLGDTAYSAPSAPTWASITPNPCSINSRPVITWGGASAGSLGTLLYDVEVRQTTNTAGTSWSNWVRLSSAQSGTSYTDSAITASKKVDGHTPFVGVKYQYRVRSSDGSYATSSWISPTQLSVGFGSPTAPTSSRWSTTTAKKGQSVTLSWSGASGGTGSITSYGVSTRYYHAATNTWDSWSSESTTSSTSKSFTLSSSLKNNDRFQARIRTKNSWGQWSSYLTTGYVTIRGNQMWIKVNGSWKEGECYIKINGSWKEGTPYIKINGSWKEST